METALTLNGEIAHIKLARHFTLDAVQDFNRKIHAALANPALRELQVDFQNVDYVDTAALTSLKKLSARAKGRSVALTGCTPAVKSVLTSAKCHNLFEIHHA